jgi:hypothetical protein
MKKGIAGVVALMAMGMAILELGHRIHYGHFVGYGVHTDVILSNSAVGTSDTYVARVWNVSLRSIDVEGCKLPGGYAGSGTLHHWDVQKWDSTRRDWSSLKDANHWIPQAFTTPDPEDKWARCGGATTRIYPFAARELAWVFKDWVAKGETVRMAIHTSSRLPADRQPIIYSPSFTVD